MLYPKRQLHINLQVLVRLFMHIFQLLTLKGGEKITIRYDLMKNSPVEELHVYRGQIIRGCTVHPNELVDEIVRMSNTLTEIDFRGVITAFAQLICKALAKSENVSALLFFYNAFH